MIVSIITIALTVLLIPVFIYFMALDKKKFDTEIENYIVKSLSKMFLIVLCIWLVPTLLLILLNAFSYVHWAWNVLMGVLYIYFSFTLITYRERIEVFGDKFIYIPILGKKRVYDFKDVTKVIKNETKYGLISYKIFVGEKQIFTIENTLENGTKFMDKLSRFLDFEK